jgi:surface protein
MKSYMYSFLMLPIIFSSCENGTDIYPESTKFYLHENGVTCMCPDTRPGDRGLLNDMEFESVDNELLRKRRDEVGFPMENVCTSLVTDMSELFSGDIVNYTMNYFNERIGNWDVSNVRNMKSMFFLSTFNQPIGNWNVSNVTIMDEMFRNSPFNQNLTILQMKKKFDIGEKQ